MRHKGVSLMIKFTIVLEEVYEESPTDRYLEKKFERSRVPKLDENITFYGINFPVIDIDNVLDEPDDSPEAIVVRAECSPTELEVVLDNDKHWQLRVGGELVAMT